MKAIKITLAILILAAVTATAAVATVALSQADAAHACEGGGNCL